MMFESEFCQVKYINNINAVFCKWKQFCKSTNYRNPLIHGLKLINDNQSKVWITDTSTGFENEEADTQWLIENFMPKLVNSTCKEVIFIIEKNSPLKEEIAGQERALSFHFKVSLVESLECIIKDS